jgi:hypothetical protein
MIVATIVFRPDEMNGSRKGKFGTWRVVQCEQCFDGIGRCRPFMEVVPWHYAPKNADPIETKALRLQVAKPLVRGCIVSPVKLAMEWLRSVSIEPDIYFISERSGKLTTVREVTQHG